MSSEANFPEPAELLDNLRIHIDGLDRLILGLVRERTRLTVAIAAEKAERGLPTFQPRRHDEVIQNYLAGAADSEGLLTRADAVDLGELVMLDCLTETIKHKVCIFGRHEAQQHNEFFAAKTEQLVAATKALPHHICNA